MRAFLREKEYEISVGIQSTNNLHRLDDAMNQAEAAMRQDKQAYYARNGQSAAAGPEREAGADPDRKAGCRAFPAGPCPQVQERCSLWI